MAGRILGIRGQGKTTFIDLWEAHFRLQLYLGEKILGESYEQLKNYDLGDYIGVTGELFKTRMGELTLRVRSIVLLAKSLQPFPVPKEKIQFSDKEKTKQDSWQLSLKKTTDILAELGKNKKKGQLLVGFAAESNAIDIYAKEKLKEKNIDLIFANKIGSKDSGFESDNSEYQIFSRQENTELKKSTKKEAALELILWIEKLLTRKA